MKSSNVSYDCRIDASPRGADLALWMLAACGAMAGALCSGLPAVGKGLLALLIAGCAAWRWRRLRRVSLEWQIGRSHLIRIVTNGNVKGLPEFFEESEVECIGPWVCLRGRVEGRLQYGLIWPWHLDQEQYRRICRLASLRHAGPALEAGP